MKKIGLKDLQDEMVINEDIHKNDVILIKKGTKVNKKIINYPTSSG